MKNWLLWLSVGIISIIGGVMALLNPLAATIAAERIAGWTFLIVGVLQMITAWRAKGFGATLWAGWVGLASLLVGISLLHNPLAGVVSLTMIVAILFLVSGAAKLITSFSLRGTVFFLPMLLPGIISIALALLILSNFPASAVSILGILLAVELISNGVALVALSLSRKTTAQSL